MHLMIVWCVIFKIVLYFAKFENKINPLFVQRLGWRN